MVSSSAVGAASALLLATAASAFRDSAPLLVWSSQPNEMLADAAAEINSGVVSADNIFGSLPSIGCDWNTAAVIDMDKIHQSSLDSILDLPRDGKADLHIPYLVRPTKESLDTAVQSWARRCGAELVVNSLDGETNGRTLLYYNVPHQDLTLPAVDTDLIVLTGTRDPAEFKSHSERDERPFAAYSAEDENVDALKKKKPGKNDTTTPPEHERYEYFTTPLLSALFVSFFIFFPILFLGLYALSGIQVPPRMMDINKSLAVNKGRKDQ